MTAHS